MAADEACLPDGLVSYLGPLYSLPYQWFPSAHDFIWATPKLGAMIYLYSLLFFKKNNPFLIFINRFFSF